MSALSLSHFKSRNLLVFILFYSKEAHSSASSQASSSQSVHPAGRDSLHLSTPDTRAKAESEPLPQQTAPAAVSSPASAAATDSHPFPPRESASSSAHQGDIDAALSKPPDLSLSTTSTAATTTNGTSSRGLDEAASLPQTVSSDAKEQPQPKPGSRGYESYRERDRERPYSDWSRDRERHYRDRSQDRDRHRRDYRDHRHHRSHRDRLPPHDRSYRDWESERRWDRTFHHPRERDRDRCSNHYHYYHHHRSREAWERDRKGHGHSSSSRWRGQDEGREARPARDRSREREREQAGLNTSTAEKSDSSPQKSRLDLIESASKEDQNHKRTADYPSRERDDSPDGHRSKKHKKSKKKKKSKDKERRRDSGSVATDDLSTSTVLPHS